MAHARVPVWPDPMLYCQRPGARVSKCELWQRPQGRPARACLETPGCPWPMHCWMNLVAGAQHSEKLPENPAPPRMVGRGLKGFQISAPCLKGSAAWA